LTIRNGPQASPGTGKLYYSISEVAELVNVKAHVLRYWETQFKMLHPRKNRAGNRSYRIKDVKMALRIKKLLYDEGFTIAGARRKLLDERKSRETQTELDFVGIPRDDFLRMMRRDLGELVEVLEGVRPIESLGHREDDEEEAVDPRAARSGLFRDIDLDGDVEDDAAGPEDGEDVQVRHLTGGERRAEERTPIMRKPGAPE
jgi:DNA-binding transcriptional MerR regulator